MATHSASAAMPPFPGAHQIFSTRGLSLSFHTSACSRPPPPRTRTFILIPRRCLPPNDRRRSHTCQLGGVDSDRKSTRLNSSHTVISYAVFCLKKKKKQKNTKE